MSLPTVCHGRALRSWHTPRHRVIADDCRIPQRYGSSTRNRLACNPILDRIDSCLEAPYDLSMSKISESYRYIVRSPDVRGGNARVEGTRIAVHDVIGLLQNGETVDSLAASCLPALTKAQVYECLAYYEDHRGEVDLLVARQMAQDQQ